MKTLHLIRHAKSSWDHPGLGDVDRPLNTRGEKACRSMARPILEAGCSFGHAFCSIARRTQLTIEGIAEVLPEQNITWKLEEDLYTFSAHDLLDWIREQDDDLVELVLIGHNPAMTDLVNALGNRSVLNVPTCGYAQIRFDADHWAELAPGAGVTAAFLTPKSLS